MRSFVSRAGRLSLALTFVALGACSDAPAGPSRAASVTPFAEVTTSVAATVAFTVDSAKINHFYGDVMVFGTATCSAPAMFHLVVELWQEQKEGGASYTVEDWGGIPEFQCPTEGKAWRLSIGGYLGRWQPRAATVTVRTDEEGDSVTPTELSQTVRLSRKR
jgi:hypothetical protein